MHGYTYILRCADVTSYAGSTKYLDDRVASDQQGVGTTYTTNRRTLALIWWAAFDRIDEARVLQKQIQGWSRAKLPTFVEGGFDAIRGAVPESEPCERWRWGWGR